MKQLTCEMCGSTELVKHDGNFVCQTCGTKYSVEEAKKMMIEGTVNVQGTVSIDSSDALSNLLSKIEFAYEDNETKTMLTLCDKALDINVNSAIVWLYKGIGLWRKFDCLDARKCFSRAFERCSPDEKSSFLSKIRKTYDEVFDDLFGEVEIISFPIDRLDIFEKVCNRLRFRFKEPYSKYFNEGIEMHEGSWWEIEDYKMCKEALWRIANLIDQRGMDCCNGILKQQGRLTISQLTTLQFTAIGLKEGIELIHDNGERDLARYNHLLEVLYVELNYYKGSLGFLSRVQPTEAQINKIKEKMKTIDPSCSFSSPAPTSSSSGNSNSSGGCYVATCVYGSYDCPEVWTLRRYRDDTLGSTWYGRLFVRTYYAISPTLVKWFGNTNWFKKFWKGKLDHMVAKLQSNGVEDTPYEDKNW